MADLPIVPINIPQNRSEALQQAISRVSILIIPDLKNICRQEGLPVSGRKAELQSRLTRRLQDYYQTPSAFDLLYYRIWNPHRQVYPHHLPNFKTSAIPLPPPTYSSSTTYRPAAMPRSSASSLKFVESPFYRKVASLATLKLNICQTSRHEATCSIPIPPSHLETLRGNTSLRILVYCGESSSNGFGGTNVKFPSQLEMRVNDQEVKANFKGVGKKEGSVKPVDITPFIRKQSGQTNSFRIAYALTQKVLDHLPKKLCSKSCKAQQVVLEFIYFP